MLIRAYISPDLVYGHDQWLQPKAPLLENPKMANTNPNYPLECI